MFSKKSILIFLSLFLILTACAKNVEVVGELPPADDEFVNEAAEQDGFTEDETRLAAESFFGSGAEIVAKQIEKLYITHGRPTAYITGTEVSGAFIAGGRYGEGVLHHKLEGEQPIKWAGPSIGFDFGLSGGDTFVLIYNLYDPEKIFQWIPSGEGQAYLVGGANVSYQSDQGIVLVTIRLGLGVRFGVNIGGNKYFKGSSDVEDMDENSDAAEGMVENSGTM